MTSEWGFTNLPQEWERYVREMNMTNAEIKKSPFEFLM